MHGTLNDFVVFHDLTGDIQLTSGQVAHLCNRRGGIGADGVIVVRPSITADFFMDYVNADGSPAEMCGNGIRCLAKYVYDMGLTNKRTLPVETRAGVKILELIRDAGGRIGRVRVDMGRPIFDPEKIPARLGDVEQPVTDFPVEVGDRSFLCSILSMGNPHCVIVAGDEIETLVHAYGPLIEKHPLFPAKTNVEFIRVEGPNRLLMRVWERGSGETFSCGTGACASAVAARVLGLVESPTTVSLLGGDLEIEWIGGDSSVFMTGAAEAVYNGTIHI
jgi:diaminopimelate epimerase